MADQIVDIISKLGVDASEVYSEIDKVNAKYGQSTEALRKQKKELEDLTKFEAGLQAQRAKTNNPSVVAQFNKEIEKTKADIDKLNKSMQQSQVEIKGTTKAGSELNQGLNKAFDGTKTQTLRGELRKLKEELANTEQGTERFNELAQAAGQVQDKIQDASQAAQAFSSESKAGTARTLFGQVVSDIAQLDFKGAADKARQFAAVMSTITLKETLAGVKSLGSALLQVGKTLITPPLGIVVAIAAAAYALYQLGVSMYEASLQSQTLTDAIGQQSDDLKTYADRYFEANLKIKEALGLISGADADKLRKQQDLNNENLKLQKQYAADVIKLAEELGVDLSEIQEDGFFSSRTRFNQEKIGFAISDEKKFNDERTTLNNLYLQKAKEAIKANNEETSLIITENNEAELKKQQDAAEKIYNDKKSQLKRIRDLEISNIGEDFSKQRATTTAKYNDEYELAVETQKKLRENKYATNKDIREGQVNTDAIIKELALKLASDLEAIDKAEVDRKIKAQSDYADMINAEADKYDADQKARKERAKQLDIETLDEEQRHQTALLEIKVGGSKNADIILLENQLLFEEKRLEQLRKYHKEESLEIQKQKNLIEELEKKKSKKISELNKEEKAELIAQINTVVQAAIAAANTIINIKLQENQKLTSLQEKRVEQARKLAEDGNIALLAEEQKRLDALNKEREKYVRRQQALAAIELIANTAVAVSKAASQTGVAAAVGIAAALLALVAGLASARSIAGQAAYFSGGEADGYTGNGNIHSESNAVGKKPYIYHKKEFIFNNEKTSKYLDVFRGVHKGEIDLNKIKFESDMYKALKANGIDTGRDINLKNYPSQSLELGALKSSLNEIVEAVNAQKGMSVSIDENGIAAITNKFYKNKKRINSIS